ncbi:transcriptional regulator GutM [Acerihabitans arboris]|uniref:Transcriptional regulator GutM n=1 Tax=Acerihabitans arboris TaxID=2691583 RepID=A0A845SFL0_9GAMM|nr:transcriptional regulator GutM [Acerihabitans arboris]NDL61866.1 transcriptional regulator GutM [Acerihabitans arboris]
MGATSLLVLIAVLAWMGQIILGGWQIRSFNRAFDALCRQGAVGVGRSAGRFKARVVLALAFDGEHRVCDGFILRGITVFARPRRLTALIGLSKEQLIPYALFPKDPALQTALSLAIKPKL